MNTTCWSEYLKGRYHSKSVSVDGRIILEWIGSMRNSNAWSGHDSTSLGQGLVAGSCEHGNEPSGSMTGSEFFE